MSAISKIQWTDRTWNPVRGCSIVSPGCVNCYAMKQAHRFSGPGKAYEGLTKLTKAGPQWTGKIRTVAPALSEPYHWKEPQRVFVNSMSDLFHEDVPFEFIAEVFTTMWQNPRHTFQILTKRPERMLEFYRWNYRNVPMNYAEADWLGSGPNIWLGVSAEDQKRADERIPFLTEVPAAVRFVSAEPLLGPIDFSSPVLEADSVANIDWVIVGGESGSKARPCRLDWIRSIVAQCRSAQVAVFVKQLGAEPLQPTIYGAHDFSGDQPIHHEPLDLDDGKGGDPSEWPEDLRVREFPAA